MKYIDLHTHSNCSNEKKSPQLRKKLIVRWTSLAASVCLIVAATVCLVYMMDGFGHITPIGTAADDTTVYNTENADETFVTSADTEPAATEPPSVVQQIGDFTVVDGKLTAYTGTEAEPVIPDGVVGIGPRAFETSPVADSITKITLGKNVFDIDPESFFGLTALRLVDVDSGNSAFQAGTIEHSDTAFLCGVNEQIIFYFQNRDDKVIDIDNVHTPYSYINETSVTFVCGNAVFDVFCEDKYYWSCRSVLYDGNQVYFDTPIDFFGGNYELIVFETNDRELVFETTSYNFSDIYYVTKDTAAAVELHDLPGYSVSFYLGEDKELRYKKIDGGYSADLEQTEAYLPVYYRITGRDDYYGEDGRVYFENGQLTLVTENIYTISDYFNMKGTDIDAWFQSLCDLEDFDNPYDSLEELIDHNKPGAGNQSK